MRLLTWLRSKLGPSQSAASRDASFLIEASSGANTSQVRSVQPEAAFRVMVDDVGITCTRPDGAVESVSWSDLRAILVETNDSGPVGVDFVWLLLGASAGCVVPMGATGEDALLRRLQSLPGFDNEALIAAITSVENHSFLCWRRPDA